MKNYLYYNFIHILVDCFYSIINMILSLIGLETGTIAAVEAVVPNSVEVASSADMEHQDLETVDLNSVGVVVDMEERKSFQVVKI